MNYLIGKIMGKRRKKRWTKTMGEYMGDSLHEKDKFVKSLKDGYAGGN